MKYPLVRRLRPPRKFWTISLGVLAAWIMTKNSHWYWQCLSVATVKTLVYDPTPHVDYERVLQALDDPVSKPLIHVNCAQASHTLRRLPWVENVCIMRQWPSTLRVIIQEKTPLALWQREGQFSLIDTHGQIIDTPESLWPDSLPIIVGKDACRHVETLRALLKNNLWNQWKVQYFILMPILRWDIVLHNGWRLLLPKDKPLEALNSFHHLLPHLARWSPNLSHIDMRSADVWRLRFHKKRQQRKK